MFYFDNAIELYEKNFAWKKCLTYLEDLFLKSGAVNILNSLVGFSWYYLIEGPIDSKNYNFDNSEELLQKWEKYLEIGIKKYLNYPDTCFISGYTLLLHGFLIDHYKYNYQNTALSLLEEVLKSNNIYLKKLVSHILRMQNSNRYEYLNDGYNICAILFRNNSLLELYFKEIFK